MAWTNISNANLDVGAPIRSIDILALRDNITAQANGDAGAPKQQTAGIADLAITAAKMSGNQPGNAPAYVARAWVNFNGTGVVAIRSSGNVTSVTDNGTGQYTVNLSVAMTDANYSVVSSGAETTEFSTSLGQFANTITDFSTTSFRIRTLNSNTTVDNAIVCASVFR
jgi:hypothetical protein